MKAIRLSSTSIPRPAPIRITPAKMPAAKMGPDLSPSASAAKFGEPHLPDVPHTQAARPRMRLRHLSMTGKSAFPAAAAAFTPTDSPAGPAQAFSGPAVISGAGDAGE